MSTKIILTVEEGLTKQEVEDLRYLLSDALGEFQTSRCCPERYVAERYPESDAGYSWVNRPDKIAQVRRRVALARKLHNPVLRFEIEQESPEEHRPCEFCGWTKAEGCPNRVGACPERG